MAVLLMVVPEGAETEPVTVMVATAAGPVPKEPRSQSRSPPVGRPTMTQEPLVVEKPE